MAEKGQICAYCGKRGSRREGSREHFVPTCLWEGERPNRTLTVWVHKVCNARYSRDDEFFRSALVAMRGTGSHPEGRRVLEGPLIRLMRNRQRLFHQHLPNLKVAPIESASGLYLEHALTFMLDVPRFFRVLEKIVRGLYASKMGKPLRSDHEVVLVWENQYTRPGMEPMLQFKQPIADFGDDVFIYRWMNHPGNDRITFWCLGFYKTVSFFAATLPKRDHRGGPLSFLNVSPMSVWSRS